MRDRRQGRIVAELGRVEAELATLYAQRDAAAEQAAWEQLGDSLEERASGQEWAAHAEAMNRAIHTLEAQRLELQLKLE